ncbi:hypothetical protein ACFXTH_046520 [Malus domestica]
MVPNKASTLKLHLQSFSTKASPTKASSMEDNYKFSKASHYLDQDSVKQNQFMVPNKSFNSKASPTKFQLQSFTYKASTPKLQLQSFTYKSFNLKASPTKASSMEDNYKFSKASHYLDQDSVKQNQFMVPNKSFNSKASPTKASTQKLHPQKLDL